jgi:ATP/maltotriose-dependent transcriptional regulator MalT
MDYDYVPCMPNPVPLLLIQSSLIYVSGERIITRTTTTKRPSRESGVSRESPMHNPQIPRQNAIVLERKRHAVQEREKSDQVKIKKKALNNNHSERWATIIIVVIISSIKKHL